VVVAVGLTLIEPLAEADVNVPGVTAMLVAPVAAQLSVLLAPEFMLVGFALKDVIAGMEPFPTVGGLTEAQPVKPTPATKATNTAQRARTRESRLGEPSLLLQNGLAGSIPSPFTGFAIISLVDRNLS
jgi:hypothetical protein